MGLKYVNIENLICTNREGLKTLLLSISRMVKHFSVVVVVWQF